MVKEAEAKRTVVEILVSFVAVLSWFFFGAAVITFLNGVIMAIEISTGLLPANTETYVHIIFLLAVATALMKINDILETAAEKLLK